MNSTQRRRSAGAQRPVWLLLTAALVTPVLVACSGEGSVPDGAAGPIGTSNSAVSGASTSSVAAYKATQTNSRFLIEAEDELTRRCMKAAGFTLPPKPQQQRPVTDWDATTQLTVEAARRQGYAALRRPLGPDDGMDAYLASLTPQERQRFADTMSGQADAKTEVKVGSTTIKAPAAGCQTETERTLYPDRDTWIAVSYVVTNLTAQKEYDTSADPDLLSATKAWSACMTAAGKPYPDPSAAIEAASVAEADAEAKRVATDPRWRELAVTDAGCRTSTGYDAANRTAHRRGLERAIARYESEILTYQTIQQLGVARAKAALGR